MPSASQSVSRLAPKPSSAPGDSSANKVALQKHVVLRRQRNHNCRKLRDSRWRGSNHMAHHRGQLTVYLRLNEERFPRSTAHPPMKAKRDFLAGV